jgi:predicted CoA-binding protein
MLDFLVNDDATLAKILAETRTIAVVGLSSDPMRPSNDVASYLRDLGGYRVIPVNPHETEVLGEKAVASLQDLIGRDVDVVEIFRRPGDVIPHIEEAKKIGAKVFWMQDGTGSREAAERAHAAGLIVVMDRCMLRDHMRLVRRDIP